MNLYKKPNGFQKHLGFGDILGPQKNKPKNIFSGGIFWLTIGNLKHQLVFEKGSAQSCGPAALSCVKAVFLLGSSCPLAKVVN